MVQTSAPALLVWLALLGSPASAIELKALDCANNEHPVQILVKQSFRDGTPQDGTRRFVLINACKQQLSHVPAPEMPTAVYTDRYRLSGQVVIGREPENQPDRENVQPIPGSVQSRNFNGTLVFQKFVAHGDLTTIQNRDQSILITGNMTYNSDVAFQVDGVKSSAFLAKW